MNEALDCLKRIYEKICGIKLHFTAFCRHILHTNTVGKASYKHAESMKELTSQKNQLELFSSPTIGCALRLDIFLGKSLQSQIFVLCNKYFIIHIKLPDYSFIVKSR